MSRARNVADIMSGVGSNVVFEDGFGLDFGAVAGSGATGSVLDDYEEGTWTPQSVVGSVTITGGNYVKIGNVVLLWARVDSPTDRSVSNDFEITNLPFSVSGSFPNTPFGSAFGTQSDLNAPAVQARRTGRIRFYKFNSGNFRSLQHNDFNSSSAVVSFGCAYFTS